MLPELMNSFDPNSNATLSTLVNRLAGFSLTVSYTPMNSFKWRSSYTLNSFPFCLISSAIAKNISVILFSIIFRFWSRFAMLKFYWFFISSGATSSQQSTLYIRNTWSLIASILYLSLAILCSKTAALNSSLASNCLASCNLYLLCCSLAFSWYVEYSDIYFFISLISDSEFSISSV